ncbi:MAG TPA: proton-conducting transporter membrane subunit [Terriglobales bacterium]|nr:proton-conducting transporter membrane subunit [Terriglobales bacterium]
MNPEQAVSAAMLTCVAGAAITLLLARVRALAGWLAVMSTAVSSALVAVACVQALRHGVSPEPVLLWNWSSMQIMLRLHVDGLAVIFLALGAGIALPAALYSTAYMRRYGDKGSARYYPCFLLFTAAIYGLLCITDLMWFFFVFWQVMTLPGFLLIRFEHEKAENRRASCRFLIMMEIACAAIMAGVTLLAPAPGVVGRFETESISAQIPALLSAHPGRVALAFGLFLAGFGIKMGLWPFGQLWLPEAHPAAPSPVSAMLSGVMIKTGVYGLMRYFLWLVPAAALPQFPLGRWGMLIAVLGTVTLFTGTMQALKQEQTKRLLAFHSIGQIGYIALGLGTCIALLPAGNHAAALAMLGLLGTLFHVLNHGIFKALLFLNAGSILHATGTQNLNRLGGLMKYMPLTGLTALIASLSISGVPLFNGFASKWAILAAAIRGGDTARYLPLFAIIAILTSAVTLASFVKFFGTSFLSRTSKLVKQKTSAVPVRHGIEPLTNGSLEVGWTMQVPQLALASLCVLLGVFPGLALRFLQQASAATPASLGSMLANSSPPVAGGASALGGAQSAALFWPLPLLALLAATFLIAYGISRIGSAPRRAAEPWLCGYAREAECGPYVAHNFYGEIKRRFGWLGGLQNGKAAAVKGRAT